MKSILSRRPRRGFALVVTLSLMILLTVIAVGLLSLSAISLRSSSQNSGIATARMNARMALMLAIGELQKHAGPDQRVTSTATLAESPENPNWTGVWRADQPDSQPQWLVSGDQPAVKTRLPDDDKTTVLFLSTDKNNPNSKELRVPLVGIKQANAGGFGWWVGDEGVKARVDLERPKDSAQDNLVRGTRSQSTLESGLFALSDPFKDLLGPNSTTDKSSLISMETLDLASKGEILPRPYFDDLTVGGHGIPVNVAQGRLKTDLSILFDRSQQSNSSAAEYLGATSDNKTPVQSYNIKAPEKFYLSDNTRTRLPSGVGPNWGILWNYANLWKNISGNKISPILPAPPLASDVRTNNWVPYTKAGDGTAFNTDAQHTNSPVNPVLAHVQLGFRIKAKPTGQPDRYQLQMQFKPVIGLWNPYNVALNGRTYFFDCGIFPWLRFGTGTAAGGQVALPADCDPKTTDAVAEVWMRDLVNLEADTSTKGGSTTNGEAKITMRTESVDLRPGEFRLFSVAEVKSIGQENILKPTLNPNGAYELDLIKANRSPAIVTGTLPSNRGPRYFWIGDMFLDDLQKDTKSIYSDSALVRYKSLTANSTSSWFALKAGGVPGLAAGGSMARYADIWNTCKGTPFAVPERILSGATSGTSTVKTKYAITDLAANLGHKHLATWAFFLRPTAQIDDVSADQRARGWIDANPRALAINPRWEGASTSADGKRQGWNFTSAFIGAAHNTDKPAKYVGDGGFGNRGLIAESSFGETQPQTGDTDRYQGLNGPSNTGLGGQPNVMIYDVPRSPLVSIGQFQHAQLSRYSHEPGFVVGNSYADLKIETEATVARNYNGFSGHDVCDISHEVNKRLWDDFYFSTLGLDYRGGTGNSFDTVFGYSQKGFALPNPRLWFAPGKSDSSIDDLISTAADKIPEAISSRIRINGAFNVNSTSKTAWKAVLASMGASELPRINLENAGAPVWEKPNETRFNRFGHVASASAYKKGGEGDDPAFWLGWRELRDAELDQLAQEIVNEVIARGPFRSLAEFVNRNPTSDKVEHRRKGALQAAIDETVNADLPDSISDNPAQKPAGPFSDDVIDETKGESQAVGHAGYLMQGDVLQSLGPILQVRSDYFRVRAYGESKDASGKVIAKAWCEAFIQRGASFTDPVDLPETRLGALTSNVNKAFGRRFEIASFRWLSPSEIEPANS